MNETAWADAHSERIVAEVWAQLEPAAIRYLAEPSRLDRAHRHRRAVGLAVSAVAIGVGGTAAAAHVLLGKPAPPAVQRSIAGVDEGLPADLRLNPDARHARSVAVDGGAVLYAADLPDGGVCTEIALAGQPMGAVCRSDSGTEPPVEATIPGVPEQRTDPIVVAGRVLPPADAARLVTSDGRQIALTIEPGGYFIIELSATESDAARRGLRIESEQAGRRVSATDLSGAFTSETDPLDPIVVEMVSGPGDLTQVLAMSGTVQVDRASTVRLVYPDGSHTDAPVAADRSYTITLPVDERGSMARSPGRLVALDAAGNEVASRTVAAVSWWHANEGAG